jgi:hypothetical protein
MPQRSFLRAALYAALAAILAFLGGCFPHVKTPLQQVGAGAPFLGPSDFVGNFSRRNRDATDGGQSTYEGSLVVTMLDRTLIEQVLPTGLHLATPVAASTQHPVIYLVGNQRNPLELRGGVLFSIPFSNDYREMILLVPFVVHDSGTMQWHSYAVRMYLDDVRPVVIGNTVYGYAKELAILTESGALPSIKTQVFDPFRTLYFSSDIKSSGPWQSAAVASASVPRWPDLQTMFEMPVVGSGPLGFVCSYWEWEYSSTEVAPVTSSYRFVESFRAGMQNWVTLGSLANAPNGAVALRSLRWRLALPPPACVP